MVRGCIVIRPFSFLLRASLCQMLSNSTELELNVPACCLTLDFEPACFLWWCFPCWALLPPCWTFTFFFGVLYLTHPIFKNLSFVVFKMMWHHRCHAPWVLPGFVLSSFWILCYYYVTDCLVGYFLGLDFLIFIFVVFYSDVSILLLEFIFKGLSFMMHAQSPC